MIRALRRAAVFTAVINSPPNLSHHAELGRITLTPDGQGRTHVADDGGLSAYAPSYASVPATSSSPAVAMASCSPAAVSAVRSPARAVRTRSRPDHPAVLRRAGRPHHHQIEPDHRHQPRQHPAVPRPPRRPTHPPGSLRLRLHRLSIPTSTAAPEPSATCSSKRHRLSSPACSATAPRPSNHRRTDRNHQAAWSLSRPLAAARPRFAQRRPPSDRTPRPGSRPDRALHRPATRPHRAIRPAR